MATLPLRAPHVRHLPRPFGLTRVISFVDAVFDVLTEAQRLAVAAHARYPFAEW